MKRRWKILIAIGAAFAVAVLISIIHHFQLRAALGAYIARLKAEGEPMELAQVVPPPVPPQENGAPVFLKAASLLDTSWNVLDSNPPPMAITVMPGKAMIGWAQPDIRFYGITNSWRQIEAALAKDGPALKLLCQITNYTTLDFHLDYSNGVDGLLPSPVGLLSGSAQRLSAKATDELHHGDTVSAVACISAILTLTKGMSHDRLITSELVRMAIVPIALFGSWEILQSPNLTDGQLDELQSDWSRLDFIRGMENALTLDRVCQVITFSKWRKPNSGLQSAYSNWLTLAERCKREGSLDEAKLEAQAFDWRYQMFMWRYWWSYSDELQMLKGYQIALETVRHAQTNYSFLAASRRLETRINELGIDTNSEDAMDFVSANVDFHSLMSVSVLPLSQFLYGAMRAETTKQIAIAAIALKRFQLKYGKYPANLDALVPEFFSQVPLDPVNGQPLRYRREPGGMFLLYSVGENGRDDGGNPSVEKGVQASNFYWQSPHALDWVWPQPATEVEIQNYYAHPSK